MSTMKAPRPPPSASPVTYLASGAHAIPPRFVLAAASAPERGEVPHRARIIVRPAIPIAGSLPRGREWDISGFQTTHPVPLPRSKTPAGPTHPGQYRIASMLPLLSREQRLQRVTNSEATARL